MSWPWCAWPSRCAPNLAAAPPKPYEPCTGNTPLVATAATASAAVDVVDVRAACARWGAVARSRATYRPGSRLGRHVAVRVRLVTRVPSRSEATARPPVSGSRSIRTRTRRGRPAIR
jgi:hypothetical protein